MGRDRGDPLGLVLGAIELAAGLDGACELEVHGAALSGQQVVVDDLAQQRVPEAEASRRHRRRGRARPRSRAARRAARRRSRRRRARSAASSRARPTATARAARPAWVAEPLDPQHERVAQALRRRAAAVERGRQQLLDVQRVAVRAHQQPVDQVRSRRLTEDVGQRFRELSTVERLELEPAAAVEPCRARPAAAAADGGGATRRCGS